MRRFLIELVLLAGCDVEGSIGLGFDPAQLSVNWMDVSFNLHRDVDVLFVVDNTAHMAPKQQALGEALGSFAAQLDELPPHAYHFGVITTDLGAGRATGECVVPGDDALLLPHGRAAPGDCLGPVDSRWLDIDPWNGDNLPAGQNLARTLGCMVQVGDRGCGYPQPLEAMRRALTHSGNQGFVREGSLLMIVLVSDGDDCSAPSDSPVFEGGRLACLLAGVECGNPPHPPDETALTDCRERSGGGLYDLSRYRSALFASGRRDPNAAGLVLLAGPAAPVSIQGGEVGPSCVAAGDPTYSALPAVRLSALAQTTPRNVVANLCTAGAAEYALGTLASELIGQDPGAHCLPAPIANSSQPRCEVILDGVTVPDCNTTSGAVPCWELKDEPTCLSLYSPRYEKNEQLALQVRGSGHDVTARCLVILPRK